jgi:hypothetical protein
MIYQICLNFIVPGGHYATSRPTTPRNSSSRHPRPGTSTSGCGNCSGGGQNNCDHLISKQRAESVHDLRKFELPPPVMRLRPQRDTRTDFRPKKQLLVTRLEPSEVAAFESRTRAAEAMRNNGGNQQWSARNFSLKRLFSKSSQRQKRNVDKEGETSPKRECYVLEELACIEVVPVEDNNHFERVSL